MAVDVVGMGVYSSYIHLSASVAFLPSGCGKFLVVVFQFTLLETLEPE